MNKLVSVVIPTRNRKKDTIDCLESLFQSDYSPFEAIVVDNASSDGTAAGVRERFPQVKVLENSEDLWASGGRNRGLKEAKGDYVFFLDSDNILHKSCLKELVSFMETDERIGIAGPKMYYYGEPSRISYAGADISLFTGKTTYCGLNCYDNGRFNATKETGHVPNAFLVSRKAIENVKEFDESYVMFFEESDFAMRAKKSGFKIFFRPNAILWHKVTPVALGMFSGLGLRSAPRAYFTARNRLVYMKRHAHSIAFLFFLVIFSPLSILVYSIDLIGARRMDLESAYLKGSVDGLIYAFTGKLRNRSESTR
ncbi:MAG: glycosyltransferase family 2 protein [Candidatus Omnitrophica bacterium]|nr:glycosyltransferase family 2 protein [Candidatus Omnitrophota bacterium]MDD5552659.1 glycosyltransferase family 2 protein [Candidatus Omnitrophota bacterium]